MAELLVKNTDAPVPDSPFRWKVGDVVVVMPDGHRWGREERNLTKFRIVKRPGVAPLALEYLTEEVRGSEGRLVLRRRYRLEANDTTVAEKPR